MTATGTAVTMSFKRQISAGIAGLFTQIKTIKKLCASATNYQSVWQRYGELEIARDEWILKWHTYLGDGPDNCLLEPKPNVEQYKALQNLMTGELSDVEEAIIEVAEHIAAKEPVSPSRDANSAMSSEPRSPVFKLMHDPKPFTLTAGC